MGDGDGGKWHSNWTLTGVGVPHLSPCVLLFFPVLFTVLLCAFFPYFPFFQLDPSGPSGPYSSLQTLSVPRPCLALGEWGWMGDGWGGERYHAIVVCTVVYILRHLHAHPQWRRSHVVHVVPLEKPHLIAR